MWRALFVLVAMLLAPTAALAQSPPDRPAAGVNRETGAPGSAGPKDDGVVQRGAQPNAGEVRPGNRDGDAPSASAGTLREEKARRIFGLPVTSALIIGAVIVAILAVVGLTVPQSRRAKARGNGTYGRER